jgi:hypothetical protein
MVLEQSPYHGTILLRSSQTCSLGRTILQRRREVPPKQQRSLQRALAERVTTLLPPHFSPFTLDFAGLNSSRSKESVDSLLNTLRTCENTAARQPLTNLYTPFRTKNRSCERVSQEAGTPDHNRSYQRRTAGSHSRHHEMTAWPSVLAALCFLPFMLPGDLHCKCFLDPTLTGSLIYRV